MSSAIQASATAAAGAYQASVVPLHFDATQALYALWKNVFASSRDAGNARDNSPAAPGDASVSQDAGGGASRSGVHSKVADAADSRSPATEHDLDDQQASLSRNAGPQPSATGGMVMLGGSDAAPLAEPMTEVEEFPAMKQPEIQGGDATVMLTRTPGADAVPRVEHGAGFDSDAEMAAEPPRMAEAIVSQDAIGQNAADSVNVFVHGSAVAIVVRDSGISDQQAVNCAFETARRLTGQRTGLARLTLNGRMLYRQPIQALAVGRPGSAALAFAC